MATFVLGCASSQQTTGQKQQWAQNISNTMDSRTHQQPFQMNRLVANPVSNEIPNSFYEAVTQGTRTMSGKPGNNHWEKVIVIPPVNSTKGSEHAPFLIEGTRL